MTRQTKTQTLPAEWAPQSGVMLTWPHVHSDWAPYLGRVEPVFAQIAREVTRREGLLIACFDEDHRSHILTLLDGAGADLGKVRWHIAPSNDSWVRDHGPITVLRDGRPLLLDFTFNGWGGKFEAELDDQVTRRLAQARAFGANPVETIPMVLEGGGIETDGRGTLLTTSRCLLAPTRNPQMNKAQIEQRLGELLGVSRVLWLDHGYLAGDDTDSHIDTLARFCDERTIAYVACDDPADEHYPELERMERELQALRTPGGDPYRLIALPWPKPKCNDAGKRLPASYANFLIINGAVLVPTYDDAADETALACLREGFPGREIIGIPCLPLILQYGSLHCVTMQLPAGVL